MFVQANEKQRAKIESLLERVKKDVAETDKKMPGFSSFLSHLNISKYGGPNGKQPCDNVPDRLINSEAYYLFLAEITNNGYNVWCINNWGDWTKARSAIKRAIRQSTKKVKEHNRIKKLASKIIADIKKRGWSNSVRVHVAAYSPGAKYRGAPADKIKDGAYHVCVYTTDKLWYVHNWKEWLASRKKVANLVATAASLLRLGTEPEPTLAYADLLALADRYRTKPPSEDNYPPGVSPKGKKVWDFVINNPRHRMVIFDTDDTEKQWKLALMIFRKVSWDKQIQPYRKEGAFLKTVVRKATRNRDKLEKMVRGDIVTLVKAGLLARATAAMRPDDVGFEKQHFFTSAVRTFKLKKGVVPEEIFEELQKRRKYLPESDSRSIGKEVASTAYAMFWAPQGLLKGNTVELYTYLYLTRDEVIGLVGGQARYANVKDLLPVLRTINKRWIKTGDLAKSRGQLRVI